MRFNPSFLQLSDSIEDANYFHTSADNANPSRSWLKFVPKEVYNQYIILDEEFRSTLEFREIIKAQLVDLEGNIINDNLGFGYKKFIDKNVLLLSFKILQDYKDQCLCIKLTFGQGFSTDTNESGYTNLYSNMFTCSEYNRERTALLTYWHLENHYEIPYKPEIAVSPSNGGNFGLSDSVPHLAIRNQIRLPLYFFNWKTEQDSSESTYATNTPVNINVSRVKRREIKNWQVVAGDWINQRLAIVSDSDYVYIDTQREITRPYEYEDVGNGGDFSISILESQPKYGDNFVDLYGLVNHKPTIISITYPNGPCCNPDGTPLIEPEIINEEVVASTCEFQGIHKRITIQGQPNSTIKYRIGASVIQGTAKQIQVWNANTNNVHNFTNINQNFIGYFFVGPSGTAVLNIRCCLEDCTPGQNIAVTAALELYENDGTTLSGEICNISVSKSCPLPLSATWQIDSVTGTNIKTVKIIGDPNSTIHVRAEILSAMPPSVNRIEMNPGLIYEEDVAGGDFWDVSIPLNGSGESAGYEIEVHTGGPFYVGTRSIYASFRIYDSLGNPSDNVVGIHDIDH